MKRHGLIICALTVIAGSLTSGGCSDAKVGLDLFTRLQSDDHNTRAAAVVEAGRGDDSRALSHLVDRLEDENADIRLFAIQGLKERTGQTLGYRSYDNELARRAAVGRWRQWLEARSAVTVKENVHE